MSPLAPWSSVIRHACYAGALLTIETRSLEPAPQLSVVVMAYNEAASLKMVADEITAEVQRLGIRYELLIIDDGSTDGTGQIADDLSRLSQQLRVIHHRPNGG